MIRNKKMKVEELERYGAVLEVLKEISIAFLKFIEKDLHQKMHI